MIILPFMAVLLIILCLSAVSAADNDNSTVATVNDNALSISDDDSVINAADDNLQDELKTADAGEDKNTSISNEKEILKESEKEILSASNDNEVLGLINSYDSSNNYEHIYSSEVSSKLSNNAKSYLSHYKYISEGAYFTQGNNKANVFYTPVVDGTMYIIVDAISGRSIQTAGNVFTGITADYTVTNNVVGGVHLFTVYNVVISQPTASLEINFDGPKIKVTNIKVLNPTDNVLAISSNQINLGYSITLTSTVTAHDGTKLSSGNTNSKVKYYLKDGTLIGTSNPGGSITYKPTSKGSYSFYSVFEEDTTNYYFSSKSNTETLTVNDPNYYIRLYDYDEQDWYNDVQFCDFESGSANMITTIFASDGSTSFNSIVGSYGNYVYIIKNGASTGRSSTLHKNGSSVSYYSNLEQVQLSGDVIRLYSYYTSTVDSSKILYSNVYTFIMNREFQNYDTNLTLFEMGNAGASGVIYKQLGESFSISNNLSNYILGSDIEDFVNMRYLANGDVNVIETVEVYLNGNLFWASNDDGIYNLTSSGFKVNPNGDMDIGAIVSFNEPGWYNFTAHYKGNSAGLGESWSNVLSFYVSSAQKTTTVLSSNSPVTVGNDIIITPSINNGNVNTGTITYKYSNGTFIDTLSVNDNLRLSDLAPGSYTIIGTYNTNDDYLSSSDSITVTVLAPTSITLSADKTNSVTGQNIKFTWAINETSATGSLNVYQNNIKLSSTVATSGIYTCAFTSAGTYEIYLEYEGDGTYGASTSNKITINVLNPTETSVNFNNVTVKNQKVIITPTVKSNGNAVLEGQVEIYIDNILKDTINVGNSYTYDAVNAGTFNVYAVYVGTSNYNSSSSQTKSLKVKDLTQITITANGSTGSLTTVYGNEINFKVTTTNGATGHLDIYINGSDIFQDCNLNIGSYSTSTINAGTYSIYLSYAGDDNYAANVSNTLTLTINPAESNIVIDPITDVSYGVNTVINFTVTNPVDVSWIIIHQNGYTITGTGLNNISTLLTVGNYTITVKNDGNKNYQSSSETKTFKVLKVDKVWVSPSGTGLGVTEADPTVWDNVADILTDNGTVVFVNGNYDDFYAKTISKPWTVTSNGDAVLNANKKGNIFNITSSNVRIEKLTFTNGLNTDNGGAVNIFKDIENVSVSDSSFINNTVNGNLEGGAIYSQANNTTISNCNFKGNRGGMYGGAVSLSGDENTVFKCDFEDNSPSALYIFGDDNVVKDSVFTNNSASHYGGAIYWNGLGGNLVNCNFTNNTAREGGAVYFYYARNTVVENCNFKNNNATEGGAVYVDYRANNLRIESSNFTENTASKGGAVFWNETGGVINNSVFTDNSADEYNHIYTCKNDLKTENSTFTTEVTITQVADGPYNSSRVIEGTVDDGTNINDYSVGIMNNNVNVAQTALNSNTYSYTWNNLDVGDYSITLTITDSKGNTYKTSYDAMTFEIHRASSKVEITEIPSADYPNPVTVDFDVTNATVVTYTVKVKGSDDTVIYNTTVSDISSNLVLSGLAAGNYTITIANAGNDNFTGDVKSADFEVKKSASTLDDMIPLVFDFESSGTVTVTYSGAGNVTASIVNHPEASVVIGDHTVTISGLDYGTYTLNVITCPDNNHTAVSKTVTVKVNRIDSVLNNPDSLEFTYGGSDSISVTYSGADNVTASVIGHPEAVVVIGDHSVIVSGLDAGDYTLNVTTVPDSNHNAVSKTASVRVNPASSQVTIGLVEPVTYDNNVVIGFEIENATTVTYIVKNSKGIVIGNTTVTQNEISAEKLILTGLAAGNYTVTIANAKTNNFNGSVKSADFTVNRANSKITIPEFDDYSYGNQKFIELAHENTTGVTVKLLNGTGDITSYITVDGYKIIINDNLPVGEYTLNVTADTDDNHTSSTDSYNFSVVNATVSVNFVNTVNVTYPENLTVKIIANVTGKYIVNVPEANIINREIFLTKDVEQLIDLGKHDVGTYTVNVTSSIKNYDIVSVKTSINVTNGTINLNLKVNNITYPGNVIIKVKTNVSGEYEVYIGANKIKTVTLNENTETEIDLGKYPVGSYDVKIISNVDNYGIVFKQDTVNVTNGSISNLKVEVDNVIYPNRAYATVTANIDGTYIVTVNNKNYTVTVSGGTGRTVSFELLKVDTYEVTVASKIANYAVKTNTTEFSVKPEASTITVPDKKFEYGTTALITVTTTNSKGDVKVVLKHSNGTLITEGITVSGNQITITGLKVANYTLTVTTNVDENHTEATKSANLEIYKSDNHGFFVNVTKRNIDYRQNTTMWGTFKDSTATGNVTFIFDDDDANPIVKGLYEKLPYIPLSAGVHKVNATYSGDDNFNPETRIIYITVERISSGFEIGHKRNNITFGDTFNLTIKIDSQATGNVTFFFDNGTNRTVGLSEVVHYTPKNATSHIIRANYSGDKNFRPSSDTYELPVLKSGDTHFYVIVSDRTFDYRKNTTLTGTFTKPGATGNVTFVFDDCESVTVGIGVPVVYKPLSAGIHKVNATYNGDSNYKPNTRIINLTVERINAGFSIGHIRDFIYFGDTFNITTNIDRNATGKVTVFFDDGTNKTVDLSEIIYYVPTNATDHLIRANYSGDVNFYPASAEFTLSVLKSNQTHFFVEVSNRTINYRQNTTLTGTFTESGATGNVTYIFDDRESVTVGIGVPVVYRPSYAGIHKVNATYNGDSNYNSTSRIITITVNRINAGFHIGHVRSFIYYGDTFNLTNMIDREATGKITYFFDDGTNKTYDISDIVYYKPANATVHIVKANYSGDINFYSSNDKYDLEVKKSDDHDFYVDVSNRTINYRENTTLTGVFKSATGATGNVTFVFDDCESVTVDIGKSVIYRPLSAGSHKVYATYNGDSNFNPETRNITITVRQINSNFAISHIRDKITYGDTFNLSVSIDSNATGNVTFTFDDGHKETVNLTDIVNYRPDSAKDHFIKAHYSGDKNFYESDSDYTLTVFKATIDVNVTVEPVNYPQNATVFINASVDGNYNVTVNNKTYKVKVENNHGNVTIDTLPVGTYSVKITADITNYKPINIDEYEVIVNNGTISVNVTAGNVVYDGSAHPVVVINVSVAGNYSVEIAGKYSQVKELTTGENIINDIPVLPVGEYTVTFTSKVDNYNVAVRSDDFNVTNGTIGLELKVNNITYPSNLTVKVKANVTGKYNISVDGVFVKSVDLAENVETEVDLGLKDVDSYDVKVTSDIDNYNTVSRQATVNVTNGTVSGLSIKVSDIVYDGSSTPKAVVNASVAGKYVITVDGTDIKVEFVISESEINTEKTIDLGSILPVGEYEATVTSNISNYAVKTASDKFNVTNGTISVNVTAGNVVYDGSAHPVVVINVSVAGNYSVEIAGKYSQVKELTTGENIINDIPVLPVGEYTVTVTSKVDNYNVAVRSDDFNVTNGTIGLELKVNNITYPSNLTVKVKANVTGEYLISVPELNIVNKTVQLTEGNEKEVDLGLQIVGNYTVTVKSNISNYNIVTRQSVVNVTNGTDLSVNITVESVVYPGKVIAWINASVAGKYNVTVIGTDISREVTVVTPGVAVRVDLGILNVKDNYNATVTSYVENYATKTNSTLFSVRNGTIEVNITVVPADYPNNASVTVNATVDGNYTVHVGDKNYTVTVKNGTGNVTVDVLPEGEYPVRVNATISNYSPVDKAGDDLIISNGTISLTVKVDDVVYNGTAKVLVNASVAGKYVITVDGTSISKEIDITEDEINKFVEFDLESVLSVAEYNAVVTSEISNYDVAVGSDKFNVTNGTIEVNITVVPADYPNNASVTVNATVDGNYTIHVGDKNYTVTVKDGTGNVTVDVLPAGNYTVNVTGEIPNYSPVDKKGDNLIISNGTIELTVKAGNTIYNDTAKVLINASVAGKYILTVEGTDISIEVVITEEQISTEVEVDLGTVLNVNEYNATVTSAVENYDVKTASDKFNVTNGTINLELKVQNITYPDNLTIKVKTNISGEYIIKVDGTHVKTVTLTAGEEQTVDLGEYSVKSYDIEVISSIENYAETSKQATVNMTNGTIDVNVTVTPAKYPENATVTVNATVDGNYTVHVGDKNYTVTVKDGTGNVTVDVLPAGNYTVNVTGEIPNYAPVDEKGDNLIVSNGTIDLTLKVDPVVYPENLTAVIKANVTGDYRLTVPQAGIDEIITLTAGVEKSVDLGRQAVGTYTVNVTSRIDNYNVASDEKTVEVTNGTISINVTVTPATYPENATVTVNSTVDGNYSVTVGNKTYNVTVKNGTGNVTIDVLPAGNYTVNVTGEVPNYNITSIEKDLTISNGTLDFNITVSNPVYPDRGKVTVNATVDGTYIVNVNDKNYTVTVENGTGNITIDQLPVGDYPVSVTSNVTNYDKLTKTDVVKVENGTIDVNVTVIPAKYPDTGKVIVNASVDGDYNVNVNGTDYTVTVENGTGNVTVNQLPAGEYPVKVTGEIPNYEPVDRDDTLTVTNGTISMNVTVTPATFPENATVTVNSTVDGNYTVKVDNKTYTVEVINGTGNVTVDVLPTGNHTVNVTSEVPNYGETSYNTTLTVDKGTIDMNVTVVDATYPDSGKVKIESDVDGNYTVTVNGKDYPVEVKDGKGETDINQLPAGTYPVNVKSDIENYETAQKDDNLTVKPGNASFDVEVKPVKYPDNATVTVTSDVDGNYTVEVDNKTYTVEVINGTGNVTLDVLPAGNHSVTVTGDIPDYGEVEKTVNAEVAKGKADFNVTVTDSTYPDRGKVTVTSDTDGNYAVEVNNKKYNMEVVNGKGSVEVDQLPAGNYPVRVTLDDANYETLTKEDDLTVKPAKTVENNDKVKLKVTIKDSEGNLVANKKVTFTYNGKTYTAKTNKNGVATINVKKTDVSTNGVIDLKKVNGKKVKSSKISKFKYSTKFKDKKGKVIAGKKVTIKFNGKTYKVKTNKNGIAKVTFKNVKSGKYKIVAKYKNIVHKATIKIKK